MKLAEQVPCTLLPRPSVYRSFGLALGAPSKAHLSRFFPRSSTFSWPQPLHPKSLVSSFFLNGAKNGSFSADTVAS